MKSKKKILKICGKILLGIVITVLIIILGVLLFLEFWPSVGKTPDKKMLESFVKKTELFYDGQFHNENAYSVMTGTTQKTSGRAYPTDMIPVVKIRISKEENPGRCV